MGAHAPGADGTHVLGAEGMHATSAQGLHAKGADSDQVFSNYGKLENKQLNLILKYEPEINLFFLLNLHLVSES